MPPKTVLIVEDNEDSRILIGKLLRRRGYEVVEAEGGEEALRRAASSRPDLILMDVGLKGMDGLAATGRLKADPATRAIPVVALTAYAMDDDRKRALAAGCDGYMPKPVDLKRLDEQLDKFLGDKA